MLERFLHDMRFAVRSLRRSPTASVVAALSIALGIGANTAIFSMLDAILWRPLPVADPGALVQLHALQPRTGTAVALPARVVQAMREQRDTFAGVTVDDWDGVAVRLDGAAERAIAEVVTADYFTTLGVRPFAGQFFPRGADGSGWEPVAVVSHDSFVRRLNGDRSRIGGSIRINGHGFRVIGVSPPEFRGANIGAAPDLRLPMMLQPGMQAAVMPGFTLLDQSGRRFAAPLARLQAGVSRAEAQSRLQAVVTHLWTDLGQPGEAPPDLRLLDGSRGRAALPSWIAPALAATLAGTLGLLVIACVNVANLFAARAAGRVRELGVRVAVGASRGRLVRQLLSEGVLIAGIGAGLGLALARWTTAVLLRWLPTSGTPVAIDVALDVRVLVYTALVALLTAAICGALPAIQAFRLDPVVSLRAGDGSVRGRLWGRRASVVVQVAFTLVLVVGAGLLARSLERLQASEAGYDGDAILLFSMKHVREGTARFVEADVRRFLQDLAPRVAELPSILAASVIASGEATAIPGTDFVRGDSIVVQREDRSTVRLEAMGDRVGPAFFRMFGLTVLAGRPLTDRDTEGSPPVVVITDAFARDLYGDSPAIGRRIRFDAGSPAYEVVGVISSRPYDTPAAPGRRVYLLPLGQGAIPVMPTLAVKVPPSQAGAAEAEVRRALHTLDPDLPIFNVRSAATQSARALARERLTAALFACFGAVALLLAAIGLYGVIASDVARRVPELAVRIALGARRSDVRRMVVLDTLRLVLAGIVLGLPLAYLPARLCAPALHGLSPGDPTVFVASLMVIFAIGACAGWLPARRAAETDVVRVMRAH